MDIQLLRRLAVSLPMVLDFTIWRAMFMNGVRIGIKKITMADRKVKKPTGPNSGEWRVLRGGSWSNDLNLLRVTTRGGFYPGSRINSSGFRCVSNLNRK